MPNKYQRKSREIKEIKMCLNRIYSVRYAAPPIVRSNYFTTTTFRERYFSWLASICELYNKLNEVYKIKKKIQ